MVAAGSQPERFSEDANQMVLGHPDRSRDLVNGEGITPVTDHQIDSCQNNAWERLLPFSTKPQVRADSVECLLKVLR